MVQGLVVVGDGQHCEHIEILIVRVISHDDNLKVQKKGVDSRDVLKLKHCM